MVSRLLRLSTLCLLLLPALLCAEVTVTVTINGNTLSEDVPFYPKISVSRDDGQEVDVDSFMMDGKPLEVEFVGDSRHSSISIINGRRQEQHLLISIYRFRMEGHKAGLHIIPPVSVMVDGRRYQSPQSAFSISTASASTGDLRLEAAVQGDEPIYPGQKLRIVYRIYFRQNIELTLSELPTNTGNAFRSIGAQQVDTFREVGYYVQEVTQELEALTPGQFRIGPAIIEGYAYEQDFFGRRILQQPRLRAEAEPITITIQSFPGEDKPPSFTGAVGDFSIQAKLLTDYKVSVGDKMELEVTLYGTGELESLSLPTLAKQTGFPGAFRLSDLPPTGEVQGRSKRFIVELRPLSEDIKAIPSIAFSFFNPESKGYQTIRSQPIGIQVTPLKGPARDSRRQTQSTEEEDTPPIVDDSGEETESSWQEDLGKTQAIQTLGNYQLTRSDLRSDLLQNPFVLLFIPIAALLLALQLGLKRSGGTARKVRTKDRAIDFYNEAMRAQNNAEVFYPLIEKALLLRLYERKLIKEEVASSSQLGRGGIVGDVRSFLTLLEAQRFSGKKLLGHDQVIAQAQKLYERIK